jgi:hypothetical protein
MTTFPTSVKDLLEHPEMIVILTITVAAIVLSSVCLMKLLSGGSKHKKVMPIADFQDFTLIKKDILSHDTRAFHFALPPDHVLGLPTGQHVSLKFTDPVSGKAVMRSYTPVTDDRTVGSFGLVIKVYRPLEPRFPEGGKMSQHLDTLAIGDTILAKGPKGHLHYHAPGKFSVKPLGKPMEERKVQQIGMMAGGTGKLVMAISTYGTVSTFGSPTTFYRNYAYAASVERYLYQSQRQTCPSQTHLRQQYRVGHFGAGRIGSFANRIQ